MFEKRIKFIKFFILLLITSTLVFAEERLPYFKFETDTGRIIKKKDLKDKPTVMIFWGIYCHTCRDELPKLEKVYQKYRDKVNFLAVVVDTQDIDEVKEFKEKIGFSYTVAFINSQSDLVKFKVFGTPTTLVISPDLIVIRRFVGDINITALENLLDELIIK